VPSAAVAYRATGAKFHVAVVVAGFWATEVRSSK
jgi:hypothetical protein